METIKIKLCVFYIISTLILLTTIFLFVSEIKAKKYHQNPNNWDYCNQVIANVSKKNNPEGGLVNQYCFNIYTNKFDINEIPQDCQHRCVYLKSIETWLMFSLMMIIILLLLMICCACFYKCVVSQNQEYIIFN